MDDSARKLIAESAIAEATGYYKLVVATATLFLGGTLVFWEKVAPTLSPISLLLLGAGWLFLIVSVMLVVFVRRDNIEMARLALSEQYTKYDPIAARSRKLTTASGACLAMGMFFVASAGMATLWEKAMATENKSVNADNLETRSMPFKEIAGSGSGNASTQEGGTSTSQANTNDSQAKK